MGRTVADRVKAKRLDMGLLQPDFAHLVGIPERTYQDYETGKRPIPSDRLVQIARRLKCDLNTFDPDYVPPELDPKSSDSLPSIEWVDQIADRVAARLAAKAPPDRAVSVAEVVSQIESLVASKTVSRIQAQIAKAFLTGDSAYLEGVSEPRRRQLLALLKSP